jgi:pyridoxamine 5'-phosphate oxidase
VNGTENENATHDDAADPIVRACEWLDEARAGEPNDPDAAALATVDAAGAPNVRMVLVRGIDAHGFVFYTNRESAKGRELDSQPAAALCFYWKSLRRQVRVRGPVHPISDADSDTYFASRPKESQIGAWASQQSRVMESRFALGKKVAQYAAKYGLGKVPRPPYWIGYRISPLEIEFWRSRSFRLHDRLVYRRQTLDGAWQSERLFP